jgi:3-mercaptopyruvate sulfurtransferase SseA
MSLAALPESEFKATPIDEPKDEARESANVCNINHVVEASDRNDGSAGDTLMLDSRESSFNANGCMPGAIHLPYGKWAESQNTQKCKSVEEFGDIFREADVNPATNYDIKCSGESGISAKVL